VIVRPSIKSTLNACSVRCTSLSRSPGLLSMVGMPPRQREGLPPELCGKVVAIHVNMRRLILQIATVEVCAIRPCTLDGRHASGALHEPLLAELARTSAPTNSPANPGGPERRGEMLVASPWLGRVASTIDTVTPTRAAISCRVDAPAGGSATPPALRRELHSADQTLRAALRRRQKVTEASRRTTPAMDNTRSGCGRISAILIGRVL